MYIRNYCQNLFVSVNNHLYAKFMYVYCLYWRKLIKRFEKLILAHMNQFVL